MSYSFPPNRALLYPQFETYRLDSIDSSTDTSSFPLPGPATQSRVGYHANHLSFKEVRSRISWDHLSIGPEGRGVYVDADWNIWGFTLDDDLRSIFEKLGELPTPVGSELLEFQPEYPSVLPLDDRHWAIATGQGSLYLLQSTPLGEPFKGRFIARYDFPSTSTDSFSVPFLLRAAHLYTTTEARLLVSRTLPLPGDIKPRSQAKVFELLEVSIDLTRQNEIDQGMEELQVMWRLQGGDVPYWCGWYEGGWLIFSEEEFEHAVEEEEETEEERIERERSIAKTKLGLGATFSRPINDSEESTKVDKMDVDIPEDISQPYSWTQDGESLTVTFTFPPGTSRSDLTISTSSTHLDLAYTPTDPPESPLPPPLAEFLTRSERPFWTPIKTSSFTYDPSICKLELFLEKEDVNTHWPSIFVPDEEDVYSEVPETFSASRLAAVRETFSQIKTREGDPEGRHPAVPALLSEEMDFDLEDGEEEGPEGMFGKGSMGKVGRDVLMGYIKDGKTKWSKAPISILSTPLPSSNDQEGGNLGIIVKSAVDGLLFSPVTSGEDPIGSSWKHETTVPALAFVLSSKTDLRMVRHVPAVHPTSSTRSLRSGAKVWEKGTTVLAFDAGTSVAGRGNVYMYYPPSSKTMARQGVMTVSGGERGALLGVGMMLVKGKRVMVCLCERELVILNGIV
ncbi:hypothetical protein TREMEDRAFT_29211 [Tremella mesenterica DSM 1558]|uniref:uncharacterized protein n=1 Tax=Tremella mesenterica (strain ATCC 24925 / CBS 8224 / DSM 1558 / NBRC 9311 / NRRL Y-6157 / RJB 2259-6 / UBC 559-6) TaxID=578456 RepID=UPI0003F48F5C|nr:uncharacterized protein TREMEDRAFT_29211 [Tremella mesenterica DSM 1558]EIW70824.1 hypothetical protein TREMEDRAFT_29211 [Tremella mesenterica DSM 1558]